MNAKGQCNDRNCGMCRSIARTNWLTVERRTLASAVKGLAWTERKVKDGSACDPTYYDNCDAWLKARRLALGLSNDLQGSETTPEATTTPTEARRPSPATLVTLTQADYAALLSMTGDMFQNVEPFGWYEIGRNVLLVHFAPALMPSSQNAMSLAEYESLAA